jgi:DNA-binding MarR family transcriptional regulator
MQFSLNDSDIELFLSQQAISFFRKLIVYLRKPSRFASSINLGDVLMSTNCKLDRIDLRILSRLQTQGRITNVELADAVGLSPSPCLIRVKRLESAGYIAGYAAQILLGKNGRRPERVHAGHARRPPA